MRKNSKIFGLVACSAVLAGAVAVGAGNLNVAPVAADEATTTVTFQMRESAQVKYGDSAAIRFSATVSESYLAGLEADTVVLKSSIDKMGGSSQQETAEWVVKGNGSTYVSGYQTNTYYHSISFTDAEIESQIKKAAAVDLTATMWLEDGEGNALTQKQTVTRSMRAVANAIYDGVDSDKQTELNKYLGTRTSVNETVYAEIAFTSNSTTVNKLILPDGVSYDTAYAGANVIADGEIAKMYKPAATGTLALFDDETNNVCNYSVVYASSVIESKEEMTDFVANVGKAGYGTGSDYYAILTTDIDYKGETLASNAASFYGTFDGNGHTISNFTVGGGGRGLFGIALAIDNVSKVYSKVCNLALVNASSTCQHGGIITGTLYGWVDNVFISGTRTTGTYKAMVADNFSSSNGRYGKITNSVIIDNSNLGDTSKDRISALGAMKVVDISNFAVENTLVLTDGIAVQARGAVDGYTGAYPDITDKFPTVTKLSLTSDADKDALKAQAKALGTHGNGWAYDETTTILTYNGQYILRVEIPEPVSETLAAQFVEVNNNGTVSLSFNKGTATEVLVEDAPVVATQADGKITFKYDKVGRASAVIITADGAYTIPFVLANYVLSEKSDVTAWLANSAVNAANLYTVLADDISFDGATLDNTGNSANGSYFRGTFDGYGHTLDDFTMNSWGFFRNIAASAVIKDLAMTNAVAQQYTVLFGSSYKGGATIENVLVHGAGNKSMGLLGGTLGDSTNIKNCIAIDTNATSLFTLGRIPKTSGGINVSNTVVVTDSKALYNNSDKVEVEFSNTTYVSGSNNAKFATSQTAAALASMNNVGDFTYNSTTGELSLMGNVVFTLSLNNN